MGGPSSSHAAITNEVRRRASRRDREREKSERQMEMMRIQKLKEDDMDGYISMLEGTKKDRLTSLLDVTDQFMQSIGAALDQVRGSSLSLCQYFSLSTLSRLMASLVPVSLSLLLSLHALASHPLHPLPVSAHFSPVRFWIRRSGLRGRVARRHHRRLMPAARAPWRKNWTRCGG